MHPKDLKNYHELVVYLKECIALDGKESRPRIASSIVALMINDLFDDWSSDPDKPEFWQIIEIAAHMEAWELYGLHDSDWQRLCKLVDELDRKVNKA